MVVQKSIVYWGIILPDGTARGSSLLHSRIENTIAIEPGLLCSVLAIADDRPCGRLELDVHPDESKLATLIE